MVDRLTRKNSIQVGGAGSVPRIQFSSGAARNLQSFAERMQTASRQFSQQADAEAEASAQDQGALDGAAGQPEIQDYGTIRGRAYNQAATTAFVTNLETKTLMKLSELEGQYVNDPKGLASAIDDYRKGTVDELNKVHPAAAGLFDQSIRTKSSSAIERVKDNQFKVVKDRAEASLIMNKMAIEADLKTSANDLFSENPKLSANASNNIQQLRGQVLSIYNAVDPNGRPLYSEEEKAKAINSFNERVFSTATTAWFDAQDDKVAALLKWESGEFKIDLNSPELPNHGTDISEFMAEHKRGAAHDGLKPAFRKRFAAFMASSPPEIQKGLRIFSGHRSIEHQRRLWKDALVKYGSSREARKWVAPPGNSQHNHGTAGDLVFNGQRLDKAPAEVRDWVHENAPSFGLHFRLDNEAWHIETDPSFEDVGSSQALDIRKALSPEAVNRLTSQMRSSITFENQLEDREVRIAEEELKTQQDFDYFEMTDRVSMSPAQLEENGLSPLTVQEVRERVDNRDISPAIGRSLIKAVEDAAAPQDDPDVERRLIDRMFRGEDVQTEIFNSKGSLTPSTFRSLLEKNRTLNAPDESVSNRDKLFFTQLKDALTSDALLGNLDDGAEMRKFNALADYTRRVAGGEEPEVVSRDILDRAQRELVGGIRVKLNGMLTPRFAVSKGAGLIDVDQSAISLQKAFDRKQIDLNELIIQTRLLRQWEAAQKQIEKGSSQ